MNEAIAKILRLQKHQQFLKDHGGRILDHDSAVLDRLNKDNPLSLADLSKFDRLAE